MGIKRPPIEESEGYKSLREAILNDKDSGRSEDERMEKLMFAVERAEEYAYKTGLDSGDILTAWERDRDYWYMNYYQDANQPPILDNGKVRVFDTTDEMIKAIGDRKFRCPRCKGVSSSPYECDSGIKVELLNDTYGPCDWKVYGLFGHMGKGVYLFVKEKMRGEPMFMPISWEDSGQKGEANA